MAALFFARVAAAQAPPNSAPPPEPPVVLLPVVRSLTLPDALKQALDRNPSVLQIAEEVGRAQAVVEEVRASSLPQLSLNGTLTELDHNRTLGGVVFVPQRQVNVDVQLTVPIIEPRMWVQWSHAKEQVDVQRLTLGEARRQLAISVGHTFLSLLAEHSVVELDELAVVNDQAHATFTEARFKGGFGNRIDFVRAQQQVEADKALRESALAQLVKYREALGVLLAVDEPVDVNGTADLGPAPDRSQALEDSQKRSDVEESQLRLVAARHVVRDDYADYLPTLSAVGFPFFQDPRTVQVPQWGWEIQLLLSWQIYDGGLRYGLGHERERLRREAELGFEGTRRQAASDVRSAADSLSRAQEALADSQRAAKLADSALQLATLAYKAGAATNIEVIDAERVSRDAETQSVVSADAARQALFDLLVASGKLP